MMLIFQFSAISNCLFPFVFGVINNNNQPKREAKIDSFTKMKNFTANKIHQMFGI